MMVKIYGYSDDCVEIENSEHEEEINCYGEDVIIGFQDGTKIRVGYSKPGRGIWYIDVEQQGTANQRLTVCDDEDAEIYSDIFEIDSKIAGYNLVALKEWPKLEVPSTTDTPAQLAERAILSEYDKRTLKKAKHIQVVSFDLDRGAGIQAMAAVYNDRNVSEEEVRDYILRAAPDGYHHHIVIMTQQQAESLFCATEGG